MPEKEEEITAKKIGECERHDLYLKGMAVAGAEFQLLITDELNVVRAVLFVHDCGESFSWVNPPTKEYRKRFEDCAVKLLIKRGSCPP